MANIVKQFVTEDDGNEIYDVYRVLGLLGVVVFLGLSVFDFALGEPIIGGEHNDIIIAYSHEFDMQAFGIGLGAVLTAAGACVMMKAFGEGKPKGA